TRFSRDWSSDVCSSDLQSSAPAARGLSFCPDGHFANSAPDLSTRLGSHSRATLLNSSARPGQKCLTSTCANGRPQSLAVSSSTQIGRASCRERVQDSEG